MPYIKPLPRNNFYAVIFASSKSDDLEGYAEMDELTLKLAQEQPGFLGYESAGDNSKGIFISYWESKEAIEHWRKNATHMMAKSNAMKWYKRYLSQVCHVESSYLHEV